MMMLAKSCILLAIAVYLQVISLVQAMGSLNRGGFIEPVPLEDIALEANSYFDKAVSLNREYLLGIDSDSLLKTFRMNAGLDAPGESFKDSWEDPSCEIRGQYLGHWLSGTAMLIKNTGDKALLEKSKHIIKELRKVQEKLGGGYLSAFPMEHFDRLRALQPVWAPFYVIHKIMAGLLDHFTFLGDLLALQMVMDEAYFFNDWINNILDSDGADHWFQMLENEFGGMEEVMFNLFAATGGLEIKFSQMGICFNKPNWFNPLKNNQDALPGRHANTHLAQVNGFAAGYEWLDDKERLNATRNFFDLVMAGHSYATGGNNNGEWWQDPHTLASTIAAEGAGRQTEETCTTYNMLKIARYLFRWTGDPKYADYYEKAILNGMLGTQRMPANYTSPFTNGISTSNLEEKKDLSVSPQFKDSERQEGAVPFKSVSASSRDNTARALKSVPTVSTYTGSGNSTAWNWRQEAMERFPGNGLPEFDNKPGPGVIIYLLPLGSGNAKEDAGHGWSTPLNSFWCCSGSTSESYSKLMDSIYFQRVTRGSPPELFINQFTPSSLAWKAAGIDVVQTVKLGQHNNNMVVTIQTEGSSKEPKIASAILKIRIPKWAASASFKIDYGTQLNSLEQSELPFYWSVGVSPLLGCRIELTIQMGIRTDQIDDDSRDFANLQAVRMGPYLMAALTEKERDITLSPQDVPANLHQLDSRALYTMRASTGQVLKQTGLSIHLADESSCLARMECTFRLVQLERHEHGLVLGPCEMEEGAETSCFLESMILPGAFLTVDDQGDLILKRVRLEELAGWPLQVRIGEGRSVTLHALDPAVKAFALGVGSRDGASLFLQSETPLGSYPEASRLLKGHDKSYVLAPLGHLVEERYTPYLQFNPPSIVS